MKVATYNVNGISSRLPVLLKWLEEEKPDVVCIQELKAIDSNFPEQQLLDAGYHAIWQGQKSWNGVAILSRYGEIKETKRGLDGDDEDLQSRYIEALINGVLIGCLYLPNGNPYPGPKFDYKLKWINRFTAHTKKLMELNLPVALIGDYNIIPTEFDTYKPEKYVNDALFQPEVRELFLGFTTMGWTDAIRYLNPEKRVYTYWDYFRNAFGRDAGMRIDHFLVNDSLKDRLLTSGVNKDVRGWEHSSDHGPVWIEFK